MNIKNNFFINDYIYNKNNKNLCIGIVQSCFNYKISSKYFLYCFKTLKKFNIKEKNIFYKKVPGVLEIPLILKKLIKKKKINSLITLGIIIKGETYHFKLISNNSWHAITNISLKYNIPIINSILSVYNKKQAILRIKKNGIYAAKASIQMANLCYFF
ncbi:6,7-dimethyl-8-ribityllumazine synthase [Candidatus Zinderia endosymbiont of Aphrophora alni]|uniref:6,7-dimethyl-8-ribityllumazine synthase n=1 Tax=Candidatus Zinderia endosymbiont of Aphrophora alni TaxID=3077951 RepID=UPI0030D3AD61